MATKPDAWRWWVRGAGALFVVIGVVILFTGISAGYQSYDANTGSYSAVSAICITAWSDWTGNFSNFAPPQSQAGLYNEDRAGLSCRSAIAGRQHVAITLFVIGLLLAGASFIRRRVYVIGAPPPTSGRVSGPTPPPPDSVIYELDTWSNGQRTRLAKGLVGVGIAHTWDETDLIVKASDEAEVDKILSRLGSQ
jgi:hypothetical protein